MGCPPVGMLMYCVSDGGLVLEGGFICPLVWLLVDRNSLFGRKALLESKPFPLLRLLTMGTGGNCGQGEVEAEYELEARAENLVAIGYHWLRDLLQHSPGR